MKRKILKITERGYGYLAVSLDNPVEELSPMYATLAKGSEMRKFVTQTLNRPLTAHELRGFEPDTLIGQFHDTEGFTEDRS